MTTVATAPLAFPALSEKEQAVLRGQVIALNKDFGPDGWRVFVSDGGLFYAAISLEHWRPKPLSGKWPPRTEVEPDARSMRETLAGRIAEQRGPSEGDLLAAYGDDL